MVLQGFVLFNFGGVVIVIVSILSELWRIFWAHQKKKKKKTRRKKGGKPEKNRTTPHILGIEPQASKNKRCPVQGQLAVACTSGENRVGSPLDTITPQRDLRAELAFVLGTGHLAGAYIP